MSREDRVGICDGKLWRALVWSEPTHELSVRTAFFFSAVVEAPAKGLFSASELEYGLPTRSIQSFMLGVVPTEVVEPPAEASSGVPKA